MKNQPDTPETTKLLQPFTFWFTFFKKSKDKQLEEFEDNLKQISTFTAAEEFWGIYQHMKRPDALPRGCEFFLFKKGIKPLWEDMANVGGGRFYLSMKKSGVTNKLWEDLQISMIMLGLDELTEINGVVMNVRTSEVIMSVWTKALTDEKKDEIKMWLKDALDLPNEQVINYKQHPTDEQLLKKQQELIKEEEERRRKIIEQDKIEIEKKNKEEEKAKQEMKKNENSNSEEESEEESDEENEDEYLRHRHGIKEE